MEHNYLTAGELALIDQRRGYCREDYPYHRGSRGAATTGVALGATGLGIAIFGGMAIAYGLNAASKARARGNENAIAQQNKTMEILAGVVNREASRNDGITLDVQQTLRSLTGATAQGGSAAALSTAEAVALALNNNGGINSAVGGCNYLRVARVSGSRLCGCDSCEE